MPFFEAIANDDVDLVHQLLENNEFGPNAKNSRGLTGLHICATYGFLTIAVLLLEYGADLTLKDDESGYTALHRSFYFGHFKLSWLFLRFGAVLDIGIDEFCERLPHKSISSHARKSETIQWDCKDKDGLSPLALLSSTLREKNVKLDLLSHRNAFAFGKSDYQLGVACGNVSPDVVFPKEILSLSEESIQKVSANKHHSLALTSKGDVFSWGHGNNGRLGHGDENIMLEPSRISIPQRIISISTGLHHSLALTGEGNVFSWGSDRFGQLGLGLHNTDHGKSLVPKRIENFKKEKVFLIGAGEFHSVCCMANGDILAWGSNKSGQIGVKSSESIHSQSGSLIVPFPKRVSFDLKRNEKLEVRQIAAAYSATMILRRKESNSLVSRSQHEIYQWGNGSCIPVKVLFHNSSVNSTSHKKFMLCETTANIIQVSCGKQHFVGLCDRGHVYSWGLGVDQLGHSSETNYYSSPKLIESLLPEKGGGYITYIEATSNRTCAVSDQGDLFAWGATEDQGILGRNAGNYQPAPKKVLGIKRAVEVALGEDHTIVLTSYIKPELPLQKFFSQAAASMQCSYSFDSDDESDDEFYESNRVMKSCSQIKEPLTSKTLGEVPTLKQFCERKIAERVDTKYVPVFHFIAETYSANSLKAYCEEFINLNMDAILTQSKPCHMDSWIDGLSLDDIIAARFNRSEQFSTKSSEMSKRFNVVQKQRTRSNSVDCNRAEQISHPPQNSFDTLPSHTADKYKTYSKETDSSISTAKLMKTIRKKLTSIDEMLGSGKELTKEQIEKISRKSSLESELSRLTFLFNRLKREEEILEKAKLSRKPLAVETETVQQLDDPIQHLENVETPIGGLAINTNQKKEGVEETPTRVRSSKNVEKAAPSKHTVEVCALSNVCPSQENPVILHNIKVNLSSIHSPISAREESVIEYDSSRLPLSSVGINGRTVLSPNKTNSAANSGLSHSSSKTPISRPPIINYPQALATQSKMRKVPSDSPDELSLGSGFTLASFMPSTPIPPTPPKPVKVKAPFKWGKPAVSTSDPVSDTSPFKGLPSHQACAMAPQHVPPSQPINSSLGASPRQGDPERSSLLNIQKDEQYIKDNSNMTYGAGSNPWYVERRARAMSLEEVMRTEEARRLDAERQRLEDIELQEALALIAEAERREKAQKKNRAKSKSRIK